MKKVHKETEQVLLKNEEEILNELKQAYIRNLVEIKKRVRELVKEIDFMEKMEAEESLIRAKEYQLNYQKGLEKQISVAMKSLAESEVNSVDAFLKRMYEDGYITQQYVINQLGIPVITPINVDKLIKTVNKKVADFKFSQRLYDDINHLAEVTIQEIANGIIQGSSYATIAERISLHSEATLKQAYTIARTEGGRVSSTAKVHAQQDAKKKGADIVKQWDATLDGKTRPEHRQLDGQIREIDEEFEVDGYTAEAPRMFGVAYLDINCRCISLTVPRWDIDETVTKVDNITGNFVEVKNYYDWKERYYDTLKENK